MDRENHPSKTTPEHVMGQTGDRSMRPPPPPQPSERIGLAGSPKWSNQPPLTKIFYKTKLCEKFETNGRCIYLDRCTFAHGVAELRRPSFAQGPTIRNPGEMKMVEAQKSGIPPAQASSGRAFPSMPTPTMLNYPRQIPEEKEGVAKISNLERLSRKKTSSIYGDWPEQ